MMTTTTAIIIIITANLIGVLSCATFEELVWPNLAHECILGTYELVKQVLMSFTKGFHFHNGHTNIRKNGW